MGVKILDSEKDKLSLDVPGKAEFICDLKQRAHSANPMKLYVIM